MSDFVQPEQPRMRAQRSSVLHLTLPDVSAVEAAGVPRWLQIVLMCAIVLGALVRFTHLDTKVYSHDETLTSLRTAGVLEAQYRRAVLNTTITSAQLQSYQHANRGHDAGSTIHALTVDDPQHPPVYYLLERWWDHVFGGSIVARRSLSAVFGLLTIPVLFWLCRELAPRAAGFALLTTAFFAVSPFELQYTQQAREYTLWGLLCALSSALFVRGCRTNQPGVWIAYAASIVVGMYSHTFFAFVIAAHVVTALSLAERRQLSNWLPFVVSVGAAALAYAPWAANLAFQRQTVQSTNTWFAAAVPLPVYVYKCLFNLGSTFFDAEYANMLYSVFLLPLAALVGWSVYGVVRNNQRPSSSLIVTLLGTAVAPLMLGDIASHASRATAARYLLPAFIAVDLAVGYWLTLELRRGGRRAALAGATAALLLALGAVSWVVSANATSWYTASSDAPVLAIAHEVERQPNALILTDDSVLALQLSNYLAPSDRFVISSSVPPEFAQAAQTNRFVLEPSRAVCAALEREPNIRLRLAYQPAFIDSPMLHMSFMDAPPARALFATLRKKLSAIRGDLTGMYRLMRVTTGTPQSVKSCR